MRCGDVVFVCKDEYLFFIYLFNMVVICRVLYCSILFDLLGMEILGYEKSCNYFGLKSLLEKIKILEVYLDNLNIEIYVR